MAKDGTPLTIASFEDKETAMMAGTIKAGISDISISAEYGNKKQSSKHIS
ncbi:hypothetical protein [Candidatus Nitrosocosmicus sp. FF01]